MNIYEFADIIDKPLVFTRHPNQEGRVSVKFDRCDIKKGSFLSGEYGNGNSPVKALEDYLKKIRGKKIIFDPFLESRQEYVVPDLEDTFESSGWTSVDDSLPKSNQEVICFNEVGDIVYFCGIANSIKRLIPK